MPGNPMGDFLDVGRIVSSFGIVHGQEVADLGCGSGYFTTALAQAVGKDGKVVTVDVMQEALQAVQSRAQDMGLQNVTFVRADLEVLGGTKIPDGSQDLSLLKNVLFQSKKKEAMLAEAARITKPGGHVVVIDWRKGAGGLGPPDELRSDEQAIQAMAQGVGLRLDRAITTDAFHFGCMFIK